MAIFALLGCLGLFSWGVLKVLVFAGIFALGVVAWLTAAFMLAVVILCLFRNKRRARALAKRLYGGLVPYDYIDDAIREHVSEDDIDDAIGEHFAEQEDWQDKVRNRAYGFYLGSFFKYIAILYPLTFAGVCAYFSYMGIEFDKTEMAFSVLGNIILTSGGAIFILEAVYPEHIDGIIYDNLDIFTRKCLERYAKEGLVGIDEEGKLFTNVNRDKMTEIVMELEDERTWYMKISKYFPYDEDGSAPYLMGWCGVCLASIFGVFMALVMGNAISGALMGLAAIGTLPKIMLELRAEQERGE